MISALFSFIFDHILLVVIIIILIVIFSLSQKIISLKNSIDTIFLNNLDKYLEPKINEIKQMINTLKSLYVNDEVSFELTRLELIISKGLQGSTNDKVTMINSLNNFTLNPKIDLNEYPEIAKLNTIEIFTKEEMDSLDNGVSISYKQYNDTIIKYNEQSGSSINQKIISLLGLPTNYIPLDPPKYERYNNEFEVFSEQEPELNNISSLNNKEEIEVPKEDNKEALPVKEYESRETASGVLKPTSEIKK